MNSNIMIVGELKSGLLRHVDYNAKKRKRHKRKS